VLLGEAARTHLSGVLVQASVLTPVIPASWEAEMWKITVRGQPGQNSSRDPISKISRAEWTGGVVQKVEHLLCKCRALSSNPSQREREREKGAVIFFSTTN
jgi:hypothetical protein